MIRRIVGAAAIVLPFLFQEQIEANEFARQAKIDATSDSSPEALSYFPGPAAGPYGIGPENYLDLIRRGSEAVAIPIIASLNGSTRAGWSPGPGSTPKPDTPACPGRRPPRLRA